MNNTTETQRAGEINLTDSQLKAIEKISQWRRSTPEQLESTRKWFAGEHKQEFASLLMHDSDWYRAENDYSEKVKRLFLKLDGTWVAIHTSTFETDGSVLRAQRDFAATAKPGDYSHDGVIEQFKSMQ